MTTSSGFPGHPVIYDVLILMMFLPPPPPPPPNRTNPIGLSWEESRNHCTTQNPEKLLLIVPLGVAGHVALGVLVELGALVLVLVGDAGLEGVVGVGLDEQVAHRLEHGLDAAGGLPVLGLEDAEADVAGVVVGDVWVVDARQEVDLRRLERVLGREHQRDAEHAARVDRVGGALEHDVPRVDVGLRVGYLHALRGRRLALCQLLEGWGEGLAGDCSLTCWGMPEDWKGWKVERKGEESREPTYLCDSLDGSHDWKLSGRVLCGISSLVFVGDALVVAWDGKDLPKVQTREVVGVLLKVICRSEGEEPRRLVVENCCESLAVKESLHVVEAAGRNDVRLAGRIQGLTKHQARDTQWWGSFLPEVSINYPAVAPRAHCIRGRSSRLSFTSH
jgi:hypothetical protein